MENPLEDTGQEKARYMISALPCAITEANSSQINAFQDVDSQRKDGNLQALFHDHGSSVSLS